MVLGSSGNILCLTLYSGETETVGKCVVGPRVRTLNSPTLTVYTNRSDFSFTFNNILLFMIMNYTQYTTVGMMC